MDMVDKVIAREGGDKIVQDPADPGGLTKFGISQRAYPSVDIRGLTYEKAKLLYINDYLLKPNITSIEDELLQEMVFDYAVHSGPAQAIKALQKLTGARQDGILGPKTLAATEKVVKLQRWDLISAYGRERISFLIRQCQSTPAKLKFLNGWIMRVLNLYT